MSEWVFRQAKPEDAQSFAEWAAHNPQIDPKDLKAGTQKYNPTVLTFVAEKDGKAVAFAPVYMSAMLAHLGFDPASDGRDRLHSLQTLLDGLMAFYVQFGIRSITTLSKPEYPVAQWAMKHHFEKDGRDLFALNLNKEMGLEEDVAR